MELAIISIIGTILAVMFGIIHRVQNARLGRVEDEKVDKETCIVGHKGLEREIGDMKEMVTYLYQDRRTWKKQNGHSE